MWSRWFRKNFGPFGGSWRFEDIERMFNEMQYYMTRQVKEMSQRAPKKLIRERILPDGNRVKQFGPFVYGYSITVGPDGKLHIREFGNLKTKTKRGKSYLDISERREPLVDVLVTNDEVQLILELPGVEKKDIQLRGTNKEVMVSVNTPKRRYFKTLELPVRVNPKTAKSKYKNGVLEVTFKKSERDSKGEELKID
jgi:HSP20 family protein